LGHWELAAAELLSLGNDSPNGLVPHSGNMHDFLLALALVGCWGRKAGCLVALTLILISSLLVVLMVLLLLLRKLSLVLLLQVLTLMLVMVTLLELLRWVV
jgi:hypothetical protein